MDGSVRSAALPPRGLSKCSTALVDDISCCPAVPATPQ